MAVARIATVELIDLDDLDEFASRMEDMRDAGFNVEWEYQEVPEVRCFCGAALYGPLRVHYHTRPCIHCGGGHDSRYCGTAKGEVSG